MSQDLSLSEVFGRNVATRREQLHLQQNELAVRLGITQDTLSRIEHGKNFPKTALIENLAKELQCTESVLFLRPIEDTPVFASIINSFLKPLPLAAQRTIVDFVEFFSRTLQARHG